MVRLFADPVLQGFEGHAVLPARAEPFEGGAVSRYAVTRMHLEVVAGMDLSQLGHKAVAVHLGQDGSGGHLGDRGICFDDRAYDTAGGQARQSRVAVAVDDDFAQVFVRRRWQCLDSPAHRKERGLQDVDFFDFAGARFADAPPALLLDEGVQGFASTRSQLLGVGQSGRNAVPEGNGSSNNGSCPATSARLVDAAEQRRFFEMHPPSSAGGLAPAGH